MVQINKNLGKLDKIQLVLSILFLITFIVFAIISLISQNWWGLFISLLGLLLSISPTLFEWKYKIDIPEEFEFAIILFAFLSIFLGELQNFYLRFWWWDRLLHFSSSIALGFIGFTVLYILYSNGKLKAKPSTIALFTFSFALSMGAVWEIFEFTMDSLFSLNMQKSGLSDTMWDLVIDAGGAMVASLIGFIYLKGKKVHLFEGSMLRFIKKNPNLFPKKIVNK